jgi:hypothetical protein
MFGGVLVILQSFLHTLLSFFSHSPLLMADSEKMKRHLEKGKGLLGKSSRQHPLLPLPD